MTILRGCGTALLTPFDDDGSFDEPAFRSFVEWQVSEGVHSVIPCGSTGEAVTLTLEEHRRVVSVAAEVVAGRVPVIAGAGSNDTKKAIALSKDMKACGATHLLHVSPMYNKPPQRGIAAHFRAIADSVDLPIVVYNVPGRTGSNIEAATTLEIAEHPNVVAVKEASGNLDQVREIIRNAPRNFSVLSGDDPLTVEIMRAGGHGVISVTSNAVPRAVSQITELCSAGNFDEAQKIDERLSAWTRAAFVESNPIPAKAALSMMGRMKNVLRLPLVPLAEAHVVTVRQALMAAGALSS
jgi:4-hydroxy-tetrahydrodipicolinate synthase